MKDPNDTRDTVPRMGSPLWVHLTVVTVVGVGVLALAAAGLGPAAARDLLGRPVFWVIASAVIVGELRPIVTPGKSAPDAEVPSVTFSFAALLYWGFPVAALLKVLSTVIVSVVTRKAAFRTAFNAAQFVLSLGAAGLVLAAAGIRPQPARPWAGGHLGAVVLAAVAYFIANFLLVRIAVALHGRVPPLTAICEVFPYTAFVNLALLSAAPLVVVVMNRSVILVLLFLLPFVAVYASAAMSVQREHQAQHDELTGLPNRKPLLRDTVVAISEAARSGGRAGLLLLDLDRFKEVNDTLGHPVGDRLLRIVGYRLTHSVRPGDVVARLGGDEFAVLLPVVGGVATAREVAVRLRAALAEPIRLEGMSFEIEASVGIALYPDDAPDFEFLLQRADVAMYLAKERRSGVETYDTESDRNSPARLSLLGDLRRALDRGEFELHFQPKVWLADGRPAGMEALVRWHHPERGVTAPEEFIPLAEQSCLMRDLTRYVVDTALVQASRWWRDGLAVQVSLNVSARDLLDTGLASTISEGLEAHGLPPEALLLEINELVLTNEPAHAVDAVAALAALGIPLSLDDFGTGYSSLVRLQRLPVSEIKIDSSFVGRILHSPEDEVIVRSLVTLTRDLGIRSVAEGVESPEVADLLRGMGCDAGQGWYFGRHLNAASATAWLAEHLIPGPRHASLQRRVSPGVRPA